MRFNSGVLARAVSTVVLGAGLLFLTACGSSSGNLNLGVAIGLAPSARSVAPGGAVTVTATVTTGSLTWTSSPAGFGTLSNPSATGVTFTAPATVSAPTVVTITATSTTSTGVSAPVQVAVVTSPAIALEVGGKIVGPQTINPGQQVSVNVTGDTNNAGVNWTLNPASPGGLTNVTASSVTYLAPSVQVNTPVTLTATSKANAGSTAALEFTVFPSAAAPAASANVAALTTGGGPVAPSTNSFYTSVTVCIPNSTTCQTIDNILVDTGSEGLRLLQSELTSLALPQAGDGAGDYYNNCVSFLDGSYLWGPVALADIYMGGEAVGSAPIQLISSGSPTVPTACSNGGTVNENTPTLLGANGILGIGPEPTDCYIQGSDLCNGSQGSIIPAYYLCPSSGCASSESAVTVSASLGQQVLNPVFGFSVNNNGTAITFPALAGASAPVADGALVFGIGTASNNGIPGTATGLLLDSNDFIATVFNAQTLSSSFIDSGSNGFFFPSSITNCPAPNTGFYCPATTQALTATTQDGSAHSKVVSFSIDDASTLLTTNDTAFGTLGGAGGTSSFDFGAPFFYGKTVFTGIDSSTQAPFYAY